MLKGLLGAIGLLLLIALPRFFSPTHEGLEEVLAVVAFLACIPLLIYLIARSKDPGSSS